MDPLSALSIAAAVSQFVDFGQRLLSETWSIYHNRRGESLALQDLSTVTDDLVQLSTGVKNALSTQQRGTATSGASVAREADDILVRTCDECNAIASELLKLMPKASRGFQSDMKAEREGASGTLYLTKESLPVGECFRKALKRCWNSKKIEEMGRRLGDVRQQIIMAATMSIWFNSRDTKGWEQQFSNRLDKMIAMLDDAIRKRQEMGPVDGNSPPDSNKDQGQGSVGPSAVASIQRTQVVEQIADRLWSKDWSPDESLLSTLSEKTPVSVTELQSMISNSLRFESMDHRDEAIANTYRSTYDWVFSPSPRPSQTGEPLWSSFPDWLGSDSRLPFWITGKPGSGKSTMMKYIVNHQATAQYLSRWCPRYPVHQINYYAWKPGVDLDKSEEGLIRTLLHQVMCRNPDLTPILCPRRWTFFHLVRELQSELCPAWTMWELKESFSRLMSLAGETMRLAIFVDGLDEFDIAPVKLCSIIQDIAQQGAIKVCVASRSWPQFSDAFANSPSIEMHLLTKLDIQSFVFGHFENIRAFAELNDLYQNGGSKLLVEAVSKAQGVFLWIALVTQTMLQAFTEGDSLPYLQAILNKMPTEIENLYDAIYSTIPTRLLPDVSAMLLMFESACAPVDWLTLWLADEIRYAHTGIDLQFVDIDKVCASLKRRLSARTRGILELVQSTKTVDYLHRTAAEWVSQPRVQEQLRATSPKDFDPCLCLLRAEIILAEKHVDDFVEDATFWKRVTRSLLYASLVDPAVTSDVTLINAVEEFYRAASNSLPSVMNVSAPVNVRWPTQQPCQGQDEWLYWNSFNGLTVQFAILPYVRYKYDEDPDRFHPVPRTLSKSLLQQAIFGPSRYSAARIMTGIDASRIASAQRLDLVTFLLEKGSGWLEIPSLIVMMEPLASSRTNPRDCQYYQDVKSLLLLANGDRGGSGVLGKLGWRRKKWRGKK